MHTTQQYKTTIEDALQLLAFHWTVTTVIAISFYNYSYHCYLFFVLLLQHDVQLLKTSPATTFKENTSIKINSSNIVCNITHHQVNKKKSTNIKNDFNIYLQTNHVKIMLMITLCQYSATIPHSAQHYLIMSPITIQTFNFAILYIHTIFSKNKKTKSNY